MRFALVSHVLPPSPSGQSMVIRRLLEGLSGDEYVLISNRSYPFANSTYQPYDRLQGNYYKLNPGLQSRWLNKLGLYKLKSRLMARFNMRAIRWYGNQIAAILQDRQCEVAVGCTGDLILLPATLHACRLLGIRFIPYIFDYYSYQWTDPVVRAFAERHESVILENASAVIVPNEFLQLALAKRYGVLSEVIHNPCDLTAYDAAAGQHDRGDWHEARIVYTGAVYSAHYDAFRNLVTALARMAAPRPTLCLYTSSSKRVLASQGIRGPVILEPHQPSGAIPALQQSADILFLPLAFDTAYPEVINTSAPGKMGEYLAAGRPILVHAPPDSFVSWYFRKYECGIVVSENDPDRLAEALGQIIADRALRQRIGANAIERAGADFAIEVARARFASLIGAQTPAVMGDQEATKADLSQLFHSGA